MRYFRVVFVDAGVAPIDIETKKKNEEMKLKEQQARALAEDGELALIAVDGPKSDANERISLRPPMLQNGGFQEIFARCEISIFSTCSFNSSFSDNAPSIPPQSDSTQVATEAKAPEIIAQQSSVEALVTVESIQSADIGNLDMLIVPKAPSPVHGYESQAMLS
ncbi:hypothetical protein V2J09_004699 [Rumex salicifolius]